MAVEITTLDSSTLTAQSYDGQETNLIPTFEINTSLSSSSYIESFIYTLDKNILTENYNFTQYSVLNNGQSSGNNNDLSQIEIDLEKVTTTALGVDQGKYILYFNFLNKKIGSSIQQLYITEISPDRTELRLDSTTLTDLDIVEQTTLFINERETSTYFLDFYINFGQNELFIANNIALDNTDPLNPTILVKLYDPLSEEYDINSTLWIVTNIEEPLAYDINFINDPIVVNDFISIQGPNFNIPIKDQINNSTNEYSYSDLLSTPISSSFTQLNSLLEEKEIDINVDYTQFEEFIHFSSAQTRLENFFYKVNLIEEYSSSLAIVNSSITGPTSLTTPVNESKTILENKINEIIKYFDGWEYYMYYSSGSWAWPKLNTEQPYQLAPSDSTAALTWFGSTNEYSPFFGGVILSASLYDNENKDNLLFSIPEYLRDDPENNQYGLFIDMVAQHFDNIWIYYKDVTNKYNADNRLESGISKDIVADAIRDFGIKLYQNNFSNQDLYTAFLGLTPDGALFPFPNITGSLPTPNGFEYINTFISASNDYIPLDDVNKSLYKRIYHNLPYLLKAKGTLPGLRALITSYGIPDTILRINEYGGKDKVNSNDWDYWQNEFNYAFKAEGLDSYVNISWSLNPNWNSPDDVPSTLAFRFKTTGFPGVDAPLSQSLNYLYDNINGATSTITLTYTGSGYTSGSYSGSIIDPYYQYGTLTFYPDYANYPNSTASVYLPFFNNEWWSVMVNRDGDDFILTAGNKIYEGGDNGTLLGFYASSSITEDSTSWISAIGTDFSPENPPLANNFSGSIQEIRYYTSVLNESVFKDYIMNPYSIEGNSLNSGPNELAFRAPLGGELYTGSVSIHPKVTGSWQTTSSFIGNSNFIFTGTFLDPTFLPNTEYFFYDQPIAGIKNAVSDKIRLENDTLPSGNVLSPFRALSQTTAASASYTPNINLLEVTFSPQDEINDDINSSLGYFNIGDFIGDPAFRFSRLTSYSDLDKLRNEYFEKYIRNYNLVDFIRLIKFFDNSLFKMIKDFVPARTSLASGITIKQTLLERNRYPQPQIEWEDLDISGTLKPTWNNFEPGTIEHFSGGTGGSLESFNYVNNTSQSWYETIESPLGPVTTLHEDQDEFYDGEFSGSVIIVTTQSLHQAYPLENAEFNYSPILYKNSFYGVTSTSIITQNQFLDPLTIPQSGEILILAPKINKITLSNPSGGESKAYIKLNKIDLNGNDNTIPLGQINNLLIKYTNDPTYTDYQILDISEYSNYYLYEISNQNIDISGSGIDTEIKNYYVSASTTQSLSPGGPNFITLTNYSTVLGNINSYFTSSTGIYTTPGPTPNIKLSITASALFNGASGGSAYFTLRKTDTSGNIVDLAQVLKTITVASPSASISASYYGFPGDQLRLGISKNSGAPQLITGSLLVTQSVSPTASIQDSIILEPYITQPNFYNSDNNALLNNAIDDRLSTIIQDADYSTGALTPTNFYLLISGSATRAAVQDSNYTLLRHITPRYLGSKSTSQNLNKWTRGDSGTYGKSSTIESLKTYVAYSDNMGGYAPEKMNTTGISIKYLISEDGDLVSPNTSPNSLSINQQNFTSGDKVELQSLTAGGFTQNPKLVIFRGGSSIEPILYNQIRHYDNPPMLFTGSLTFSDRNPNSNALVDDFTATLSPSNSSTYYTISSTAFSGIYNDQIIASGSDITPGAGGELPPSGNKYVATSNVTAQNLDLIFEVNINCLKVGSSIGTVYARVLRKRGGITTAVSGDYGGYITGELTINFTITIPKNNIQTGDEYSIAMLAGQNGVFYKNDSTFKISTNPYPTPPISTTNLWRTGSGAYSNSIYTTNPQFIQYFKSANVYQDDIEGSGFFPITTPVSIERGDEFRFEGDETKTFVVDRVELVPQSLSSTYLYVYLDRQISGSNININEFLLRRYIDNASGLLLNGLKPSGFDQPYLIKPEYVSKKMEQNIGKYIEDFTNKGLL